MPHGSISLSVFVLSLIIILMAILYTVTNKHKEQFVTSANLQLVDYNDMVAANGCGERSLEFTSLPNILNIASERAIPSDMADVDKCGITGMESKMYPTFSRIKEQNISYDLTGLCMRLLCTKKEESTVTNRRNVTLTFHTSMRDQVAKMLMLNPLYLEIDNSDAYTIAFDTNSTPLITNYNPSNTSKQLVFRRLLKDKENSKNQLFAYNAPKPIPSITRKPTEYGFRVYYLNYENKDATLYRLKSNAMSTYAQSNTTAVSTIFDNQYQTKFSDKVEYYFHQNIYASLTNAKYPTLTFVVDVNLEEVRGSVEIMRVYLNTASYGTYLRCGNYASVAGGRRTFNILRILANETQRKDDIQIVLDTSNMSSRSSSQQSNCIVNGNSSLSTTIARAKARLIITVSPFEKTFVATWGTYYVFNKTMACSRENDFAKFTSEMIKNPPSINAIYDTKYVNVIDEVRLGHQNYLDLLPISL